MSAENRASVEAYAAAHGLEFVPFAPKPIYRGTPLGFGQQLGVSNVLRASSGRPMEFGNFSYAWPLVGENALAWAWDYGYLALKLDRKLPQILLQSKWSPILWDHSQGYTVGPEIEQRLLLEGNFNDYFDLYCPKDYETDALYIFTPDVMALFIDETAPFDSELIDDWLFVYSRDPFDDGDAEIYDRLLRIVDLVGAKVVHQTDGYRDEQVGDFAANVVSFPGRRVRQGVPWRVYKIIAVATLVVFVVIPVLFFGLIFLILFLASGGFR
jgi:hypothetical protein